MSDGIENSIGQITGWLPILPRDAHHAAFEAYIHVGTRALLVKFWFSGVWEWWMRRPECDWEIYTFSDADATPEQVKAWGDRMLAYLKPKPPTAA